METYLEHKDGRFQIMDPDGTSHRLYANISNVVSYGAPTSVGTLNWGSSGTPNDFAMSYFAAWRAWYYAFRYSNRLLTYFDDLKIRVNTTNGSNFARASWFISMNAADIQENFVHFHELGHAAGHVASGQCSGGSCPELGFQYPADNCWPNIASGMCTHSRTSPEWGHHAFEEGMASFLGLVGTFWSNAPEPIYCRFQDGLSCDLANSNTFDAEDSLGGSCSTNDNRIEVNVTKWLWDLYDTDDQVNESYADIIDTLAEFTESTWEDGKNEPYATDLSTIDDADGGRSGKDFQQYFDSLHSISSSDSSAVYSANCSPVGD